jgi:hypothetical protein
LPVQILAGKRGNRVPDGKATNPKEEFGDDKIPFHLFPETATAAGALAFLEGGLKYGRMNWRAMGVKATTYNNALRRHMNDWMEGEDIDPDSGLSHLYKALACVAILIDAEVQGNLTDDRHYKGGYHDHAKKLTEHVKRLKEKYKDRPAPHHWTIADSGKTLPPSE